ERPVEPDRIDLDESADERGDGADEEKQAERSEDLVRPEGLADDVRLGGARAPVLGVLLDPDQEEMDADSPDQERRQQHDVEDEEPAEHGRARKRAAKRQKREVR